MRRIAGMTPKTNKERQDKLRQTRAAQGIKRLELYAHPEDWPRIRAYAEKLTRKRVVAPAISL